MSGLRITGLVKRYGARAVFDGLDLAVDDGECFTLLGPSGCGKTVLLRLIAGFEAPDKGSITIGEMTVVDGRRSVPVNRRGLGIVFQDYAVWPHMTVAANIAYPLKLMGLPQGEVADRTRGAVTMVGLDGLEDRLPSQLSGGQQQRVALARALVPEPRLLLLDEPLNNLDANLREEMRFEIKALQGKLGITVLYVTHDQEIALSMADRLAVMDGQGRLRQIGTAETVYEAPADEFVFRFLGVANFLPRDAAPVGFWPLPPPDDGGPTAGFRPSDVILSPEGAGLPAVVRRASFLGAQVDYQVECAGHLIRATTASRAAPGTQPLFAEGEACHVSLAAVRWFNGSDFGSP